MRADIYQSMARVEDAHWWFRGRRYIVGHVLRRLKLHHNSAILDAGSGTGGNLALLSGFGRVYGMELDDEARALANGRGVVAVEKGRLPEGIPFEAMQFDLACMFDVLEHVEEDEATLASLHGRLKQGGRLLLTVPAFPFLWSAHDESHHHKRRYRMKELAAKVEKAGFTIESRNYINFWLFPAVAAVRLAGGLATRLGLVKPKPGAELGLPPGPVNRLLTCVFASEAWLIDRMDLPFGVSIILVARK